MTQTIDKPRLDGPGSNLSDGWQVIVLDDNHNTFEGVASALAAVVPGLNFAAGLRHANEVHFLGQSLVWTGMKEIAELYWEQLKAAGLTMAPLQQG